MDMWRIGDNMAKAATLMTDTTFTERLLGSAWPGYFSKPIAEAMYENIKKVGLPAWSEDDQNMARGLQKELKVPMRGLATKIQEMRPPRPVPDPAAGDGGEGAGPGPTGGGSDDIGDVSWNVPTITLRYPSNIPGGPGHNWANAISMATPIAHKGIQYGAKVMALTVIDLLERPELIQQAWEYFRNVQTKDVKYVPLMRPEDQPAIWMNAQTMAKYREQMKKYYF